MAGAGTYVIVAVVLFVAAVGGYIALFGIPPELKRKMEEKALETMGENKASYLMKDAIGKVPASDQKEIKDAQKGISSLAGGSLQNPLGKFAGDAADEGTRDFTGR